MTPSWLLDLVAAIMLVVAGVSAARLAVARPWRPDSVVIDTDIAHLLMAIAMAGMLAPSLRTFPSAVWELIFGALIVVFGFRVVRDARGNGVRALAGGHCAPHLVHSAAMLYMFLAIGPAAGMAAMAGMSDMSGMEVLKYPTLAFAFTLILVGYAIWDLDQLSGRRYSLASTRIHATAVPAMAGAESAAFSGLPVPVRPDAAARGGGDVSAVGGAVGRLLLSPAITVGARIVMGVAMAFMLLITI